MKLSFEKAPDNGPATVGHQGGTVVISYDDGAAEDYTLAFPVHQRHGVPAEICMPSAYVGREGRLTREKLVEMEAAGWEMVSHTKHHVSLEESALRRSARRGETRLYIANPGHYKPSIELSILDGAHEECVTVTGSGADEHGTYIEVAKPIERDYVNRNASIFYRLLRRVFPRMRASPIVRLSDVQSRVEIESSRHELESMGVRVRHFTYPFNRFCPVTKAMVSRCYESARAGAPVRATPNAVDRHALGSTNFEKHKISDDDLVRLLEAAQQQGSLCILRAHTQSREFSVARLEQILLLCRKWSLTVSTRSEYFALR